VFGFINLMINQPQHHCCQMTPHQVGKFDMGADLERLIGRAREGYMAVLQAQLMDVDGEVEHKRLLMPV
jgi:hypothetical protein